MNGFLFLPGPIILRLVLSAGLRLAGPSLSKFLYPIINIFGYTQPPRLQDKHRWLKSKAVFQLAFERPVRNDNCVARSRIESLL